MSAEATPGTRARFSSGAAEAWTAASRFAVVALMLLVIFIVTAGILIRVINRLWT